MLYSRFFHIEDITRFPVGGARPGQRRAQHRAGARTGADGMERWWQRTELFRIFQGLNNPYGYNWL